MTLSRASDLPVSVSYATAAGTATAGTDYEDTNGTLRFAPGETERAIRVLVHGDETPEPDETFTVTLSGAVNAELESAGAATGTIVNDDTAVLAIVPAVSVLEGDGGSTEAVFTVTLSPASELPASARYVTAAGTATAGTDYEETGGTLTFAPGETERMIRVPVYGDETLEADETFTVTLGGAVNAELESAGVATGTIVNDDTAVLAITPPVVFRAEAARGRADDVGTVRVPEGDSGSRDAVFTVTLSPASELPARVQYVTAAGTATAGTDYEETGGALTFAPGETERMIRVAVYGDETPEADETFTVTLSGAVNAELRSAGAATATDPQRRHRGAGDHAGSQCAGRGQRQHGRGVHGDAEPGERAACERAVRDGRGYRHRGHGLPGSERHAELRAGRDRADDPGGGAWRRDAGGGRGIHAHAERSGERRAQAGGGRCPGCGWPEWPEVRRRPWAR